MRACILKLMKIPDCQLLCFSLIWSTFCRTQYYHYVTVECQATLLSEHAAKQNVGTLPPKQFVPQRDSYSIIATRTGEERASDIILRIVWSVLVGYLLSLSVTLMSTLVLDYGK